MNELKAETAERVATSAETPDDAAEVVKKTRKKRVAKPSRTRTILLLIVPLLLVLVGAYMWLTSGGSESTDNAQVKTDIVSVTAQVTGPVIRVPVHNGQHVNRGDVLFVHGDRILIRLESLQHPRIVKFAPVAYRLLRGERISGVFERQLLARQSFFQ